MSENINLMIEKFYKTFYQIEELELKRDIKCLTMNEFHAIDTINENTLSMNIFAESLGVTMGTATTTVDNLVNKNFVKRNQNPDDRRKVFVSLTKKGILALNNHKSFHSKMVNLITKDLSKEELEIFIGIFSKLHNNLYETLMFSQPQKLYEYPENSLLKVIDILGSRGLQDFFFNENIKIGSILKIIKKDKINLTLSIDGKKVDLDAKDSFNLMAIPYF